MLEYAYGHDEIVSRFVAGLIPSCRERGFGPAAKAIGVVEGDKLIAGVVFHNYEPDAGVIEISGATLPGKNWLTRETIRQIYQYPFLQLGCQMVVQRTSIDNERALRIMAAYGYSFIKVPRMYGRDLDGVLCLLTYEDWVNNRFNKRFKHHVSEAFKEAA